MRRLIVLVLLLLMVLPAITYSNVDLSAHYGLRQLFWFGASNCQEILVDKTLCKKTQWMTEDGW